MEIVSKSTMNLRFVVIISFRGKDNCNIFSLSFAITEQISGKDSNGKTALL